jgi:hypothetical protein
MTEGGIAGGLNRAKEQRDRAGWLRLSEVIPRQGAMTEGGIAGGSESRERTKG